MARLGAAVSQWRRDRRCRARVLVLRLIGALLERHEEPGGAQGGHGGGRSLARARGAPPRAVVVVVVSISFSLSPAASSP